MSDIVIGDLIPLDTEGVSARTLTAHFAIHEEGLQQVLLLLRLAGLLTVGDALTEDEVAMLFRSTEEENPVGIIAIEQFLSLDLLRYARDPKAHEDQLRKSFSGVAFSQVLENVVQTSLLRDARRLFEGDFGRALEEERLWPLQFMTTKGVHVEAGSAEVWRKVGLEVFVWEREN